MLCAHTRKGDCGIEEQTLRQHSQNVAELCANTCRGMGLESLGYITGLLHDAGKAAREIQEHLRGKNNSKINHSAAGMRWLWERYRHCGRYHQLAAEMAAHAIGCHHSGRCDFISPDGSMIWKERMQTEQAKRLYEECVQKFFSDCCTEKEIDIRMQQAAAEVKEKVSALLDIYQKSFGAERDVMQDSVQFSMGFLQRFLFSALVDADWADTACYMEEGHCQQCRTRSSELKRGNCWLHARKDLCNRLQADIQSIFCELKYPNGAVKRVRDVHRVYIGCMSQRAEEKHMPGFASAHRWQHVRMHSTSSIFHRINPSRRRTRRISAEQWEASLCWNTIRT